MKNEIFKLGSWYVVTFVDHFTWDATRSDGEFTIDNILSVGPTTLTIGGRYLGETEDYFVFATEVDKYFGEEEEEYDVFYVVKGTIMQVEGMTLE